MNKKVGIMTFHRALNYGAVLQTYGLQQFMFQNNIENEVINYYSPAIEKCYKPFNVSNKKYIRAIGRGLMFGGTIRRKKRDFNHFVNNHIKLSKKSYYPENLETIKAEYDIFVTGSDQVWSPTGAAFDAAYFLTFAESKQKYSYAASIGTNNIPNVYLEEFKRRLQDYQEISVREQEAKELLERYMQKKIQVHVDPTFLLDKVEWAKICKVPKDNGYILLFNVEKPINNIEYAKKIAREQNKKLVFINDRTLKKERGIQYIEAPSPEVFLGYFMNADLIITNSFHGTAFSIICQKNFVVELENQKARNIRAENLLKEFGLIKQSFEGQMSTPPKIEISDWNHIEEILEHKKNDTRRYLLNMVE